MRTKWPRARRQRKQPALRDACGSPQHQLAPNDELHGHPLRAKPRASPQEQTISPTSACCALAVPRQRNRPTADRRCRSKLTAKQKHPLTVAESRRLTRKHHSLRA
eukprot:15457959-Alexandrium_andersonii.AAC.1